MNKKFFSKLQDFYNNPIICFGLILIVLTLVLFLGCNFQFPEFFTDRELALQLAQTVSPGEVAKKVRYLINPEYNTYNNLFQIWGYSLIIFLYVFIFKITKFSYFKSFKFFYKKLFIYLWINLSYLVFSVFYVIAYMINIDKYVYNSMADTMAIPFFSMIAQLTFIGIIYYSFINLLSFITFNTHIRRRFYQILWLLCLLICLFIASDVFAWKFTYFHLVLDFYFVIWVMFIVYAVRYKST